MNIFYRRLIEDSKFTIPAGRNLQLSDAQEVHYSEDIKLADIAAVYRKI